MAIVEATRELEPRDAAPIGWEGRRLDEMLAESERLFAETGSYAGLAGRARAEGLRPDRLREALQPSARRARLRPRDGAQHLRLADRARARRALLRALHARGRLDRALHRDHRPRPHDVRRDQVDGPPGLRGQPGIRPGDIFANNDPTIGDVHNADVQTFVPIFDLSRPGEPRARRVGRRRHPRARHRRVDPGRRAGGPDQPARRRHRPPVHEDRRARRDRPLAPGALREADPGADVLPARRAHPAGRLPHGPRGGRAGDPRGGHRPLQAVQSRGDRGGPALVQVADPRDDRPRALPNGLVHGQHLRRQGPAAGTGAARLRHARAVRGPDRRRRRLRARPRRLLGLGLALDELHARRGCRGRSG